MKSADAKRQIILPWKKSFEITIRNLRIRLLRNLLTVLSLVLAVTFLSYTMVSNDIAQGLLSAGGQDIVPLLTKNGIRVDMKSLSVVFGAKDTWIAFLSLLVCTVGIVNAQLMSVTERFREIGIMKCLGALDIIVLRLFLMEAGLQGVAGALCGAILGFCLALSGWVLKAGFMVLGSLSGIAVLTSLGIAVLTGCLLSLIGVLYPAILAAKMRPAAVMKTEI